ncbi:MAG: hypothetical protein JWN95_333 [Frankiales bacterium]|nr:hypothetical protein [Frankiales bacterium]
MSSTSDRPPTGAPPPLGDGYVLVSNSDDFAALRRTFRRFVFPMTALFLLWYALYVLLSNYAHGFMSTKVAGNIHLGLVLSLLQFVSTFAITILYARWADHTFDPAAAELSERVLAHGISEREQS